MPQASRKKRNKIKVETNLPSPQARVDGACVVSANAASSPLWKGDPSIQDAGAKLIASGTALAASMGAAKALRNELEAADGVVATRVVDYDAAHAVYKAHVERVSVTPEDAASLGMTVHVRSRHALNPPVKVEAWHDMRKSLLRIHAWQAPGMQACIIEISATPEDPGSWKQLPGIGCRQALSGYGPGTYWVRAASVRASERSEFTVPVPVIVR